MTNNTYHPHARVLDEKTTIQNLLTKLNQALDTKHAIKPDHIRPLAFDLIYTYTHWLQSNNALQIESMPNTLAVRVALSLHRARPYLTE